MVSISANSPAGYYDLRRQAKDPDVWSQTLIGTLRPEPINLEEFIKRPESSPEEQLQTFREFLSKHIRKPYRDIDAAAPSHNAVPVITTVEEEDGFLIIDGLKMEVNER